MDDRTLRRARKVLSDPVRLHAYQAALEQVCADKVVCEIGVGVGALSLMALRLGAAHVYGIDADADVLQLASQVIARNGFDQKRFTPVRGHSMRVDLPERVDVVIADVLEQAALGENVYSVLEDARQRFAKPDAAFVPSEIELRVALVRPRVFQAECEFWDVDLFCKFDMDFGDVVPMLRTRKSMLKLRPDEVASEWQTLRRVELANPERDLAPDSVVLEVHKPGKVEGVCFAYDAALLDGVRIGNLPVDQAAGPEQGFQPFAQRLVCGEGDLVEIGVSPNADELDLASKVALVPEPAAAEFMARRAQ